MTPDLLGKREGDGAVFRQLQAVSLVEGVVAALKDAFFSGMLKPGAGIVERLKWAREAALETVRWVAGFEFPDFEQDYEFVALRHPGEYPIDQGRIVSDKGLDIPVQGYGDHFVEEHRIRPDGEGRQP